MAKYAHGTTVPVRRSMDEAKQIVMKHGGSMVSYGWRDDDTEVFGFSWLGVPYRFTIPHSKKNEAENRRQWRVLCALKLKPLFELASELPDEGMMLLDAYRLLEEGGTVAEKIAAGKRPISIGAGKSA